MPSIRDVAKMAGVSPASVSRILNNDKSFHINENTRKRVIEVSKKLKYNKSKNKSGPKENKGMNIGLILRHSEKDEAQDPYFQNIHDGIIEEADKWRLETDIVFRMHDKEKNLDLLSKYGAIILVGQMTNDAIEKLKNYNKNIVLVDADPVLDDCTYIQNDFTNQTTKILNYLYKLGHRNIVYVGGRANVVDIKGKTVPLEVEKRALAYSNWMKVKGLNKYEHLYIRNWTIKDGYNLCNQIINESQELPSAILVGSDPMALGVYKALKNHNIKIPEEVSVVSFDDVELNRYLTPALSSVYMDSKQMGHVAVRLVRDMMIEEENAMPLVITCRSKFNLRESVMEKL
ncbi:LacI family transcriptional regulator [Lactobacillus colini]|uniref:LacI family transcriptional regulator n=1 Tax=Lactobacillus colini TaxID=1819254 RepID=A0ABS4MEW8_9LACO|nr:LacI family DNA-binding transcriptional regulator [Lactobacillus colini]MBP2058235.1 LacI family transcriptional regulator [Lactobacillus colini]